MFFLSTTGNPALGPQTPWPQDPNALKKNDDPPRLRQVMPPYLRVKNAMLHQIYV
jgi:hypothetical protein